MACSMCDQQICAIVLGVATLVFWTAFFVSSDSLAAHRMVSANLFHTPLCRWGMTTLVCAQLVMVSLFVSRYHRVARATMVFTAAAIVLALVGWCLVVVNDPLTAQTPHLVGSGLFSAGTCIYTLGMLRLAFRFDATQSQLWYDTATACVAMVEFLLAIIYLALFFMSLDAAWIFQNLALLVANLEYTAFFWFHPFDSLAYSAVPDLRVSI